MDNNSSATKDVSGALNDMEDHESFPSLPARSPGSQRAIDCALANPPRPGGKTLTLTIPPMANPAHKKDKGKGRSAPPPSIPSTSSDTLTAATESLAAQPAPDPTTPTSIHDPKNIIPPTSMVPDRMEEDVLPDPPIAAPMPALASSSMGKKRKIGRNALDDHTTPQPGSSQLRNNNRISMLREMDNDNLRSLSAFLDPPTPRHDRIPPIDTTMIGPPPPPQQFPSILSFTPKPPNGWPQVHLVHPLGLFDNIDGAQLTDWRNLQDPQGPPLIVQLFNHGAPAEDAAKTMTDRIRFAIKCLTGYDAARVSPPTAMYPPSQNMDGSTKAAPHSYLVHHLPMELHNHLLTQYVWSTKELTMMFYKPEERVPEFLFGLKNYTDPDPSIIREIVLNIFLGSGVLDNIHTLVCDNPDFVHLNHQALALNILHSLRVVIIDAKLSGD
ncbi:hypothetical protein EW026_g6833 [Hermanssonia centrifuga]|uniref:Uncharacterized protein n=1 Tax=Hermanssonia centrifuga TaxID=98765 RepID=A0A4S4K9T1_9APHY|nr:hypothetical protein EW026_g6833 [Hermanssonia centrifuga]